MTPIPDEHDDVALDLPARMLAVLLLYVLVLGLVGLVAGLWMGGVL